MSAHLTRPMEIGDDAPFEPEDPWNVMLDYEYITYAFGNTTMTRFRPYLGPPNSEIERRGPEIFSRYVDEARTFLRQRIDHPPEAYDQRRWMLNDVTGMFIFHDIKSIPWADLEDTLWIARDLAHEDDAFSTGKEWRERELLRTMHLIIDWRFVTRQAAFIGLALKDDEGQPVVFHELLPRGCARDTHGNVWISTRQDHVYFNGCYTCGDRRVRFGNNESELIRITDNRVAKMAVQRALPDIGTGVVGDIVGEYLGTPSRLARIHNPEEAKRKAERDYLASRNRVDSQRERYERIRKIREWDNERWVVAGRRYAHSQREFERQFDRFAIDPNILHRKRLASYGTQPQ